MVINYQIGEEIRDYIKDVLGKETMVLGMDNICIAASDNDLMGKKFELSVDDKKEYLNNPTLLKLGVFGEVALNNTYPLVVAPLAGKVAAVQLIFNAVFEVAAPVNPFACAVGGLDKVRNVPSEEYPVP